MVDTNGGYIDIEFFDLQLFYEFSTQGLPGLGAEAADTVCGVVAGKRGEIHAGNGAQQPGGLPFFFHGASRNMGLGSPFDGAGVDAKLFYPVQIQRDATI